MFVEIELDWSNFAPPETAAYAALPGLFLLRRLQFVAPPKIHFNKLVSFSEQMAARGFAARSRVLAVRAVEGESDVTAQLGLPADSRLVKLERLRQADGQPFGIEVCHLSADQFPAILRAPLERRSLFRMLEQDYGVELAYADTESGWRPSGRETSTTMRFATTCAVQATVACWWSS